MIQQCNAITAAELAQIDLFKDDEPAALEWLAGRFEVRCAEAGEQIIKNGDPATEFMVVLEGEIHFARDGDPNVFIRAVGQPTGVLPFFPRMTTFRGTGMGRAVYAHARHARICTCESSSIEAPALAQKLVNEMITTAPATSPSAMSARTKCWRSANSPRGWRTRLNNPASAVVRSASRLRDVLVERRKHAIALKTEVVPPEAQSLLTDLGEIIAEAARHPRNLDALERADLEATVSDWLDDHHLSNTSASTLVETGIPISRVEPLIALIGPHNFEHGMHMLAADFEVFTLSREIEEASRRIADLVHAVKSYSYMDRVPTTEVDVEQGIEVTLRMFQHQLKHGYQVKKVFAGDLPKIHANGGELNQIWTNLIDNAVDAMRGVAREDPGNSHLHRAWRRHGGHYRQRLRDDSGSAGADLRSFLHDQGCGKRHRTRARYRDANRAQPQGLDPGALRPGRTVFQVRLPLSQPEMNSAPPNR